MNKFLKIHIDYEVLTTGIVRFMENLKIQKLYEAYVQSIKYIKYIICSKYWVGKKVRSVF